MREAIYKLPQEFLHKLKKIYPHDCSRIATTFLTKRSTTFRINYAKTDLNSLRKALQNQRVKFKELSFPQGAFILKGSLRDLQKTEVYQQGQIFVQGLSSMLPVLALSPENGENILDLCAAPGAKTTQIFSLAPESKILAIEKIRTRYYKLLANLKVQGADSVKVMLIDSIWVRKKFPEQFDKILADVPCSCEGRFLVSDPKTFKFWKQKKVKEMAHKQKKLLHSAFFALKEGGIMVYSTCTFSPEENEEIIDWFLNKFKDKAELMPLDIPSSFSRPALARWKEKKFSSDLRLTRRIIPNDLMGGFFIAKIRKISV
ncbi:MAG: RsmB/NOP family class I SAM-dependent RNA methyltransferase [Candidatus Omnitrophica bacterium]|nr:RsmB/NOP family class I SAM-dependent RNA methyltransferase [Candidatus Omnitrophota bacterium]MDD5430266.1 RsmB/NOP family class I SAM-dependent RNA methyltransferase [Candidatus Omnitrophota bacterium]